MKKIAKYKALGLLLLTFGWASSCNDFINKLPENEVPAAEVDFTSMANAYAPVAGLYQQTYRSLSSWAGSGLNAVRGDDVEKGNPSPTDQSQFTEFHEFDYSNASGFWALNGMWTSCFNNIMSANLTLATLDKYEAGAAKTEADKKLIDEYRAEVRFLRAFSYFYASRLFGALPVFVNNADVANIEKTPYVDVVKFIMSECTDAAALLPRVRPKDMPGRPGAASAFTALALKAKAAGDILDYPSVLSATNEIISSNLFVLYPNYYYLFKRVDPTRGNVNVKLCEESLFEFQFSNLGNIDGTNGTEDDNFFAFQGPANPIGSFVKFGSNNNNLSNGWGFLPPTTKFKMFMEGRSEGIRLETSIWTVGEVTMDKDTLIKYDRDGNLINVYPSMYSGKAYVPSDQIETGANRYGSGNNVRVFRYADILLLNAEAMLSEGGDALTPFNLVRTRAGMPTVGSVTLPIIMDERLAELGLEWGNRYYDLARTGLAATELANQGLGWTVAKRFYPVPLTQIDLNPNMGKDVD